MENQVKNKIVVWRENFRLDAKYESETNSAESYLEEMRIPEVLQECYDILKSHNELEIIVPILQFLEEVFARDNYTYLTFSLPVGNNLCAVFRKTLTTCGQRKGTSQRHTILILIAILRSVQRFKEKNSLKASRSNQQKVFDKIPIIFAASDFDYFVGNCLTSSTDSEQLSAVIEFFKLYTSVSDITCQRSIPVLENCIRVFNLSLGHPTFDRKGALEFFRTVIGNMKEISTKFQKQFAIFCSKVFQQLLWKCHEKEELLNIIEFYINKHPKVDISVVWSIEWLSIVIHKYGSVGLECLKFSIIVFDSDKTFIKVPELDNHERLKALLQTFSFNLQNLLLKLVDSKDEVFVWKALHELLKFILRRCQAWDEHTIENVNLLKAITLQPSLLCTIQHLIFDVCEPERATLEVLGFLEAWSGAVKTLGLDLMLLGLTYGSYSKVFNLKDE